MFPHRGKSEPCGFPIRRQPGETRLAYRLLPFAWLGITEQAHESQVYRSATGAHRQDRGGGHDGDYAGGSDPRDVSAVPSADPRRRGDMIPIEPGAVRYEEILQPVTGRAVPVMQGEILKIELLEGPQCVDFNCFNLHDYKDRMSVGHMRRYG